MRGDKSTGELYFTQWGGDERGASNPAFWEKITQEKEGERVALFFGTPVGTTRRNSLTSIDLKKKRTKSMLTKKKGRRNRCRQHTKKGMNRSSKLEEELNEAERKVRCLLEKKSTFQAVSGDEKRN